MKLRYFPFLMSHVEEKWLKRLQMVQFECPKYRNLPRSRFANLCNVSASAVRTYVPNGQTWTEAPLRCSTEQTKRETEEETDRELAHLLDYLHKTVILHYFTILYLYDAPFYTYFKAVCSTLFYNFTPI